MRLWNFAVNFEDLYGDYELCTFVAALCGLISSAVVREYFHFTTFRLDLGRDILTQEFLLSIGQRRKNTFVLLACYYRGDNFELRSCKKRLMCWSDTAFEDRKLIEVANRLVEF